jgi:hypothetical protein
MRDWNKTLNLLKSKKEVKEKLLQENRKQAFRGKTLEEQKNVARLTKEIKTINAEIAELKRIKLNNPSPATFTPMGGRKSRRKSRRKPSHRRSRKR